MSVTKMFTPPLWQSRSPSGRNILPQAMQPFHDKLMPQQSGLYVI